MAVAGIEPEQVNARHLGVWLGPTHECGGSAGDYAAPDMLVARDGLVALEASEKLEELNGKRRIIQDAIFEEACVAADSY